MPPPTRLAPVRALKRYRFARLSPRGGGTGAGVDANESGHGTPQNGQRSSTRRMWRAHEGQARRRAFIRGSVARKSLAPVTRVTACGGVGRGLECTTLVIEARDPDAIGHFAAIRGKMGLWRAALGLDWARTGDATFVGARLIHANLDKAAAEFAGTHGAIRVRRAGDVFRRGGLGQAGTIAASIRPPSGGAASRVAQDRHDREGAGAQAVRKEACGHRRSMRRFTRAAHEPVSKTSESRVASARRENQCGVVCGHDRGLEPVDRGVEHCFIRRGGANGGDIGRVPRSAVLIPSTGNHWRRERDSNPRYPCEHT